MAFMATLRVKMFKWQLYKMTYIANRRMDLPKKRGHFDVLRHRSKELFLLFFFTTSPPILQAVSVTAGIRPTKPVSGHKLNVCSYFHNRSVGTSVRSLAGGLAKSQCHPKKTPKTNSLTADDTLTANTMPQLFRPGEGSRHVGHLLEALSGSDEG